MATRNDKGKETVNPRLRRKMLDRWENEGGKVGQTNGNMEPPQRPATKETRRQQQEDRTVRSK